MCHNLLNLWPKNTRTNGSDVYFSIITTFKEFQVIRNFYYYKYIKVMRPADTTLYEANQFWITPGGKTTVVARKWGMSMSFHRKYSFESNL
jgi:hypothetical protein